MAARRITADVVEGHGGVGAPRSRLKEHGFTVTALWARGTAGARERWVRGHVGYHLRLFAGIRGSGRGEGGGRERVGDMSWRGGSERGDPEGESEMHALATRGRPHRETTTTYLLRCRI